MKGTEDKQILVVEDEPDVQLVLRTALEDAGFTVVTASDGHQAYKQMKKQVPDFITLDLVMPRQSGVLFYKKIRNNTKWSNVPVMIITAHAKDDLGQEDFKELMDGKEFPPPDAYLEKPVDTTLFVKKVATMLDIDTSTYRDETAEDERAAILATLKTVDPRTLDKVRAILDKR